MNKKILLSITLLSCFNIPIKTDPAVQDQNSYDTILEILSPGLSALKDNQSVISPLDRYKTVLTILKQGAEDRDVTQVTALNKTTINDLGILFYDVSKPLYTILKKINRTTTTLGECSLANMLITPLSDIKSLQARQNIIRFLVQNDEARISLRNLIEAFANQEDQLLALWNKNDLMYSKNMAQSLFNNKIHKKHSAAQFEIARRWYDLFEVSSPFLGYGIAQFIKKLTVTDKTNQAVKILAEALPASITLLGALIAWKTAYSKIKNRKALIFSLKKRFQSLVSLGDMLINLGAYGRRFETTHIPALLTIREFSGPQNKDIHTFFHSLTSRSFSLENGYWNSFIGPLLAAVPQFLTIKDRLAHVLHALGEIDALLSIATLIKEYELCSNHYCYAEYTESTEIPILEIDQFWHPNFFPATAIANDLQLGGTLRRNMIITGPNAGGKSTYAKGAMLAALFAQTLTVVAAKKVSLTPFTLINTYLNIVEDAGNATSQHRAEVRRAHELIKKIQSLPPDQFALTVMDEMFRCTNPATGAAAAFGIGKILGTQKNSLLMLATHYFHLTQLAHLPESSFANYHVAAVKNTDGSFTYSFTVKPGINAKVIALDLLQHEGFDPKILEYAYEHLKRVQSNETAEDFADMLRKTINE